MAALTGGRCGSVAMETVLLFLVGVSVVVIFSAPPVIATMMAVIDGDISVAEGVMLFGLIMTVIYLAVSALLTGTVAVFIIYAVILYGPWVGMKLVLRGAERAMSRRMVTDDERRYWRALERDPTNAGAHEYLGRLYKKRRMYEAAIHHLQESLRLASEQPSVRWQLQDAIAEQEKQRGAPGAVAQCLHCRQAVPPGPFCPQCGNQLEGLGERDQWVEFVEWVTGGGRRQLWVLGGLAAILILLSLFQPRSVIPPLAAMLLIVVGVFWLYLMWQKQRSRE